MKKNGIILLLILLCVAFLVSCGTKGDQDEEKGELVRYEAGELHSPSFYWKRDGTDDQWSGKH